MLISQALSAAAAMTGQSFDSAVPVRWLSELDGRLAFELYRMTAWTPYDPTDDLGCELLVPFPWDGLYIHHLEAMTYFTNGEYDRYENARVLSEQTLAEFRAFLRRTCGRPVPPPDLSGGGVTVLPEPRDGDRFFWLSAYDLAVKHGFTGGEEAWLASLVGPKGDPGGATPSDVAATRRMLAPVLSDPAGVNVNSGYFVVYDGALYKTTANISADMAASTFTSYLTAADGTGGLNDLNKQSRKTDGSLTAPATAQSSYTLTRFSLTRCGYLVLIDFVIDVVTAKSTAVDVGTVPGSFKPPSGTMMITRCVTDDTAATPLTVRVRESGKVQVLGGTTGKTYNGTFVYVANN